MDDCIALHFTKIIQPFQLDRVHVALESCISPGSLGGRALLFWSFETTSSSINLRPKDDRFGGKRPLVWTSSNEVPLDRFQPSSFEPELTSWNLEPWSALDFIGNFLT
jgi:hypothetical protein